MESVPIRQHHTLGFVVLLLVAVTGCTRTAEHGQSQAPHDSGPNGCAPELLAPAGSEADFTAGPTENTDYLISDPLDCPGATVPTWRMLLTGKGQRVLYNPNDPFEAPDWYNAVVEWKLSDAGVAWETLSMPFSCGGEQQDAITTVTDNWGDANRIATIIATALVDYDMDGTIQLLVRGTVTECPPDASPTDASPTDARIGPDAGQSCGDGCNPVTNTGCQPGERCAYRWKSLEPMFGCADCAALGPGKLGEPCTIDLDTGFDDCGPKLLCYPDPTGQRRCHEECVSLSSRYTCSSGTCLILESLPTEDVGVCVEPVDAGAGGAE